MGDFENSPLDGTALKPSARNLGLKYRKGKCLGRADKTEAIMTVYLIEA
jgi:hypothetical protein